MAIDKAVDSVQLNKEMLATANAIRTKGGTEDAIPWEKDTGYEQAVLAIKGGGAELNFEVVGGDTVPENPVENTIWVKTTSEITGWIVSPSQPENPAEGLVWVKTDSDYGVEFALTEESTFIIYVLEIRMYTSGEWDICDAQAYISEEWVDVTHTKYLYKPGDQCVALTGGWLNTFNNQYTLEFTESNMVADVTATDYFRISTKNPVLLTGYKTLYAEAYVKACDQTYGSLNLGVSSSSLSSSNNSPGDMYSSIPSKDVGSTQLMSLDISGYAAETPYAFVHLRQTGVSTFHISRVWLE